MKKHHMSYGMANQHQLNTSKFLGENATEREMMIA
jgi:hypothetical protein